MGDDNPRERGRRAIEHALRSSEDRFRQVVEAAPNAMVMVGASGLIEMVNAQAEKVFGYPRHELLGRSIEMLVPERFRSNHPTLRRDFFASPATRAMGAGRDLYGLRRDGSEFPVEIGLNPLDTDEGVKVLSAIVDISDRKHREERIHAALKEKDVLLGEIHHRVKNNLQIIYSLLDLHAARVSDPGVFGMLRDSQSRIRSMALIHQTLYESKDFEEVDFSHFLDSLVPTLISSYGIDPERIRLSIDAANVRLPINAAIPCGLMLNELISNALKHAFPDRRGGRIEVTLTENAPGHVALSVADDGIGLPAAVETASVDTLGLQLVTLLVDQLDGTLTVRRADPTRFVVAFQVRK
jgi:PAS domain S-box-containing protein